MKKRITVLLQLLSSIRLLPHIVILVLHHNNKLIRSDIRRWAEVKSISINSEFELVWFFVNLMTWFPEFRNQFYIRLGWSKLILRFLCLPLTSLHLLARDIGEGLFIQHGFSTMVFAKKIGKNCWINQQVSIGYTDADQCPTSGDNVVINARAKVLGGVTLGNNSIVGANAVVTKNLPENCTVVGRRPT